MQVNEIDIGTTGFPGLPPEPRDDPESTFIDPLELEALALLLEHSLKIHTAHQFFCWSQGMLQNLIAHDVLICALRRNDSAAFQVDSFSSTASDPAAISNLFGQDAAIVPPLLERWEEGHCQPVQVDLGGDPSAVNSHLGRELARIGATELLGHGMHDTTGRPTGFFVFACQPGAVGARQRHLAALLVPSLHAAWVHTQLTRPARSGQVAGPAGSSDLLTSREQEILGWIYRGKSNIEIGMILGISPLTVKNHVQKILRRLNVLNRAQAVGKALALRILDGALQR